MFMRYKFIIIGIALGLIGFVVGCANITIPSERQIHRWQMDAERGDARAQYKLGSCYYNGQGVETNYTEAVKWFRKSAEKNNAMAQ